MAQAWYERLTDGLARTRESLQGQFNVLLRKGPDLDAEFWSDLEDALIAADMGAVAVAEIVDRLRDSATRKALPDAQAVLDHLVREIADEVRTDEGDLLEESPLTVLVVGINGTGKTTTVGKLAKALTDGGRRVVIGSGDTFRAAAIEQLRVWASRAGVPVIERERGTDPASVCFDTLRAAEAQGSDLVLIDTAGRLHTSPDLMAELQKVHRVTERESRWPVKVILVMDATTGQNGIVQAREFHRALGLDGIVLTKLDGTAKGGIVVQVVRDLGLPVLRIGVGEGVEDLRPFDADEFARALIAGD
jgi:fused signal recognition particle receptor